MKEIEIGTSHIEKEQVAREMSASNIGSGLLEVYSTPSMIALMEKTSYLCIEPYLDHSESSVGGALNIRHLKPTAIGETVTCQSTVIEQSGKKVVFELAVMEGNKQIGTGTHVRFVIDKATFMQMI
ncbi:MAG: thioesterase family protein [Cyclobacteriaceae bacterium]|nr:thioesterase family protein [Cyclobacteriaceae bacterium]